MEALLQELQSLNPSFDIVSHLSTLVAQEKEKRELFSTKSGKLFSVLESVGFPLYCECNPKSYLYIALAKESLGTQQKRDLFDLVGYPSFCDEETEEKVSFYRFLLDGSEDYVDRLNRLAHLYTSSGGKIPSLSSTLCHFICDDCVCDCPSS